MGILYQQLEIRLSPSTEAAVKGPYDLTWDRTQVTAVESRRLIPPELLFWDTNLNVFLWTAKMSRWLQIFTLIHWFSMTALRYNSYGFQILHYCAHKKKTQAAIRSSIVLLRLREFQRRLLQFHNSRIEVSERSLVFCYSKSWFTKWKEFWFLKCSRYNNLLLCACCDI
jgi:hypothetical protein